MWSGGAVDHFVGGAAGQTFYAVFDPATDSVGPVQTVIMNHDMFCPGIVQLPNGDVIIVAGSAGGDGARSTSVWTGSSFASGPQLVIARGYNSAVLLANSDVRSLLLLLQFYLSLRMHIQFCCLPVCLSQLIAECCAQTVVSCAALCHIMCVDKSSWLLQTACFVFARALALFHFIGCKTHCMHAGVHSWRLVLWAAERG